MKRMIAILLICVTFTGTLYVNETKSDAFPAILLAPWAVEVILALIVSVGGHYILDELETLDIEASLDNLDDLKSKILANFSFYIIESGLKIVTNSTLKESTIDTEISPEFQALLDDISADDYVSPVDQEEYQNFIKIRNFKTWYQNNLSYDTDRGQYRITVPTYVAIENYMADVSYYADTLLGLISYVPSEYKQLLINVLESFNGLNVMGLEDLTPNLDYDSSSSGSMNFDQDLAPPISCVDVIALQSEIYPYYVVLNSYYYWSGGVKTYFSNVLFSKNPIRFYGNTANSFINTMGFLGYLSRSVNDQNNYIDYYGHGFQAEATSYINTTTIKLQNGIFYSNHDVINASDGSIIHEYVPPAPTTISYTPVTLPITDALTGDFGSIITGEAVDIPVSADDDDTTPYFPADVLGLEDVGSLPTSGEDEEEINPDAGILGWLGGIWGLLNELVNPATADIDTDDTTTAENELEEQETDPSSKKPPVGTPFSLPNLFALLGLILVNILLLFVKGFVIVGLIFKIPSTTALFNATVVDSINRTRIINLGQFNMTLIELLSWIVMFVFTFMLLKVLNKHLSKFHIT